jgi:HEAT repeat protein
MEDKPLDVLVQYDALKGESVELSKKILSDCSQPRSRRIAAAIRLGGPVQRQERETIDLLLSCTDDSDIQLRKIVIRVLGCVNDKTVLAKLRSMLRDNAPCIRGELVKSLAMQSDDSVFGPCCHLLAHGNEEERIQALAALAQLGTADAKSLLSLIQSSNEDPRLRLQSALFLAKNGDTVPTELESQLNINEGWMRFVISCALAKLGSREGLEALKGTIEKQTGCNAPFSLVKRTVQQWIGIEVIEDDAEWSLNVLSWIRKRLE